MTKDEMIAALLAAGLIDEAEEGILRRSTLAEVIQTYEEIMADEAEMRERDRGI